MRVVATLFLIGPSLLALAAPANSAASSNNHGITFKAVTDPASSLSALDTNSTFEIDVEADANQFHLQKRQGAWVPRFGENRLRCADVMDFSRACWETLPACAGCIGPNRFQRNVNTPWNVVHEDGNRIDRRGNHPVIGRLGWFQVGCQLNNKVTWTPTFRDETLQVAVFLGTGGARPNGNQYVSVSRDGWRALQPETININGRFMIGRDESFLGVAWSGDTSQGQSRRSPGWEIQSCWLYREDGQRSPTFDPRTLPAATPPPPL